MIRILTILLACCALWTQMSCADPLLKNSEWQKVVQTPEDRQRLAFFQSLYEKSDQKGLHAEIPRVFHVIWLGPSAFPAQSAAMMRTWLQKHPGWQMKLWTDRDY